MSFELQNLDCNCNNCVFMERDFETYKKWSDFHKDLQLKEFNSKKDLGLIRKTAQFQFDKSNLIQYGKCTKLKKQVSFIPNILQLETQECFKNRKQS